MPATTTRRRTPAKKTKAKPAAAAPQGKPIAFELLGLGCITLGIMLLLSGAFSSGFSRALLGGLRWLFGTFGAWGIALALIALGLLLLIRLEKVKAPVTAVGTALAFLAAIGMVQLAHSSVWAPNLFTHSPGGLLGSLFAWGLHAMVGDLAWALLVFLGLCGVALMTDVPLWQVLLWPFRAIYVVFRWMALPIVQHLREKREAIRAAKVAALQEEEALNTPRRLAGPPALPAPALRPAPIIRPSLAETPTEPDAPALSLPPITGTPSPENPEQLTFDEPEGEAKPKKRSPKTKSADDEAEAKAYTLPPTTILTLTPRPPSTQKDDMPEKILRLEETLRSFGIEGKVVAVERGPRVIRFEVVPPPGIRVNRIVNLADDLALALEALDVRVEAPVPGKGVVGIEVPTKELAMVDLREILESDVMRKTKSHLTFVLGRDIAGQPRVADLAKMPHLLIAGQTNSGKSVCINSLICSILMRCTPQQVKFLMVDPKRVELSLYQSIPHLIAPVAYDARHAAGLLRWAIREMEQRYEWFADKGVRNIVGFNEQSRMEGLEELPYIVIIIDELADLMMQAAAEFEASICRLAQLARATGMHLVVATQRPSVNVITGTIKANIPSRISFAVASQVDSRTILDMNGAERLVGYGDMLYLPVDAAKPTRIQGAYVSETDTNLIVDFVKSQGKPHFTDEIAAIEEEALRGESGVGVGGGLCSEPEDEMFEKALDYVRTTKYASTSMLQRKFRIGYTRAARLMDKFEELGYVGPGQGSKPREVIFAPSTAVTGRAAVASSNFDDDEPGEEAAYFDEEDEEADGEE
jgi:S-DNA-T family DNA segregation ATPase FtsK/SpoIIIE